MKSEKLPRRRNFVSLRGRQLKNKNWRKVKLGEVMKTARVDYEKVKTSEYKKTGHLPIFDQGSDAIAVYTDNPKAEYKGKSPAILFGDHTLKLKIAKSPFAVGADGIQILEPDEDLLDRKFFYYALKGLKVRSYGYERHMKYLRELDIACPNFSVQKRIADILSAFDDKIELNNKISRTLEQMAQAIFKEWFVKNKKSITKKIGDIAKVVLGGTPSRIKREYWDGDIPWINSGKVNEFRIISASENITSEGLKKSNTQLMPKRTTVIAITGATLGQVSLLEIEAAANQSVIGIFDSDILSPEFIYLYIKHQINDLIQSAAGGAQQHINKQIVETYPILVPDSKKVVGFSKIIKPIFDKITNIVFENQKLAILRDLLLPKLMSGKIRV